eukprot:443435-Prorocentrum_minimum.AAC.1
MQPRKPRKAARGRVPPPSKGGPNTVLAPLPRPLPPSLEGASVPQAREGCQLLSQNPAEFGSGYPSREPERNIHARSGDQSRERERNIHARRGSGGQSRAGKGNIPAARTPLVPPHLKRESTTM